MAEPYHIQAPDIWSIYFLRQFLIHRKEFLETIIREKEQAVETAPKGCLHTCTRRGYTEYYWKHEDSQGREYIADTDVIRALAQKSYDKSVLNLAIAELRKLTDILRKYPSPPEDAYANLSTVRQSLVEPIALSDEEFTRRWQEEEYLHNTSYPDGLIYPTARGEKVRSKSEVMIADYLYRNKVPYRYEMTLYLEGFGTVHPDFTVLNVRTRQQIYLEHFGCMDDPAYVRSMVRKVHAYQRNGIFPGFGLVMTFETGQEPFTLDGFDEFSRTYFM